MVDAKNKFWSCLNIGFHGDLGWEGEHDVGVRVARHVA